MKKSKILLFSAAVALSVAAGGLLAHAATQPVYVVDVYVGAVQVSINGGSWKNADVGMELKESDKIKTGANSYCEIVMPNRGIFRLEANTEVVLKTLAQGSERIQVNRGNFIANIINRLSPEEKFEVETATAVVAVRGTRFEVEVSDDEESSVSVQKGSVEMTPNVDLSEIEDETVRSRIQDDFAIQVNPYQSASLSVEQNERIQQEILSRVEQMIDDAENRTQNMVDNAENRINQLLQQAENNIENAIDNAFNPQAVRSLITGVLEDVDFQVGSLTGNARNALNQRFESLSDNSVRSRMNSRQQGLGNR